MEKSVKKLVANNSYTS